MWHILLWLSDAHHISFYLIDFQLKTDFPFQFCIFYRKITLPFSKDHLALLNDWFLKKMLLKRAKTRRLFFVKL